MKDIKFDEFQRLCSIGCTAKEIAAFFQCSHDAVERWCKREHGKTFTELHSEYFDGAFKVSLRRRMFEQVERGNTAMLIFMAKNHLGMADKPEITKTTAVQQITYLFQAFKEQGLIQQPIEQGEVIHADYERISLPTEQPGAREIPQE